MVFKIDFSEEKNLILKETRGVSFEDIIECIESKKILGNLKHHNAKKYPNQRILVVKIKEYIYAVPYVINENKGTWFLKTVYPSRKLTKKYEKK